MINRFFSFVICLSLLVNLFIAPFSVVAQEQSVIITEIMVNPEGVSDSKISDSNGEWIEVFNNSQTAINLDGLVINDGEEDHKPIPGTYIIPPNGYAVICRNEDILQNGGVKCDYESKMTLSNEGEIVILKDPDSKSDWSKALNPVTHYLLSYGREPGVAEFGNPNIGGKDSTSYTVYDLSDKTRYYFKVLAVNNCKPGDFSNELSTETFGITKSLLTSSTTEALGASSDQEIFREAPQKESVPQSQPNVIPSRNIFTLVLDFFGVIVSLFGRLFN